MPVLIMALDDIDKKIIVGLSKGLSIKDVAKEIYNIKDEGNRAQICYTILEGKLNLMMWDYDCKTDVQLVVKLVAETKDVNVMKEEKDGR